MKLYSYEQVVLKESEFIQAQNLYLKGCRFVIQTHTPSQTQWKNFHESPKAKPIFIRLLQCDIHCAAHAFCSAQQKVGGRNTNLGGYLALNISEFIACQVMLTGDSEYPKLLWQLTNQCPFIREGEKSPTFVIFNARLAKNS